MANPFIMMPEQRQWKKMWDNLWLFSIHFFYLCTFEKEISAGKKERKKGLYGRKTICAGSINSPRDERERIEENL